MIRRSTQTANNKAKIVIIGGGFSGLASAALLAKDGYQVTLLEKNTSLGGRARVLRSHGFQFDMGPSWYLMPEVFEQFFAKLGYQVDELYRLTRLDPRYQVHFTDGESVTLSDNLSENMRWFESQEKGAGRQLEIFLEKQRQIYQLSTKQLMRSDLKQWQTWLSLENWLSISKILSMQKIWQSWDRELSKYFSCEKLKQVLGFSAVFLGGSPYTTPSLYSLLSWADFGQGVWYPQGGMIKVVDAIERLARFNGAKIIVNSEVSSLQANEKRVSKVITKHDSFEADVVIAATDLAHLELDLLEMKNRSYSPSYWKGKQLSISGLILYLGLNKRYKKLVHHTLFFSDNWQEGFRQILEKKEIPKDPSFYLSVRSATDRSIVPKNCEELFVLVPLGARSDYRLEEIELLAEQVICKIEHTLQIDIQAHLAYKKVYSPINFMHDYNAFNGTALGLAHTFNQSLWWRPHNRSKTLKNLYYTGQYTNPGVGVPMALISAEMVAQMIHDRYE